MAPPAPQPQPPASALTAESIAAVLYRLTVPDTNAVRQAEHSLEAVGRSPACVSPLTQILCSHHEPSLRQLAAVMLRRYLPGHWVHLRSNAKAPIKAALLPRITAEPLALPRKAVISLLCELCAQDDNIWPELLDLTAQLAVAASPDMRIAAYLIIDGFVDAVNDLVVHKIPAFAPLLARGMDDPVRNVRVAALYAFVACTGPASMTSNISFNALEVHIPKLVEVTTNYDDTHSDEFGRIVCAVFEVFTLVMEVPRGPLIKKYFQGAVDFAERIFVSPDAAPVARSAATEYLVGSAMVKPKNLRKLGVAGRLVQSACTVVLDNAAFAVAHFSFGHDDDDADEDETNAINLALRLLDAMARRAELSRLVFQEVMTVVPRAFEATRNADNATRDATSAAGYRIISAICMGCTGEFTTHVKEVTGLLIAGAMDASVNFATRARAIEALGLACEALDTDEMPDEVLAELANASLSAVLQGMRDPELFVNRHACMSLEASVALFKDDTTNQLRERVGEIIRNLCALSPEISVEAITAVGVLAEHAVTALSSSEMFNDVVEGIVRLISQTDANNSHARVAALQAAASLVSQSSDKSVIERLAAHAIQCLDSDDPTCKQAAYSFFSRMADAVGGSVVAVYGVKVLTCAVQSIENPETFDPIEGDEEAAMGNGPGEEGRGEGWREVRTALLEEKTVAIDCLGSFASATTTCAFLERVAPSLNISVAIRDILAHGYKQVDDLTFCFHEEIRASAYRAFCRMIGANVSLMANCPAQAFGRVELTTEGFSRLTYGVMEDSNIWVTTSVLRSLATFIELVTADLLAEHKVSVLDAIHAVLISETACQEPREYDSGDDHFTDDADTESDDIGELLDALGDVIEAMVHSLRGFFAEDFPRLLEHMLSTLYFNSNSPRNRGMVLGSVAGILLFMNFERSTDFNPPAPGTAEHELALKTSDDVAAELLPIALSAIQSKEGKTLQRNAVFLTGVIFSKARASNTEVWARLPQALGLFQEILVSGTPSDGALLDNAAGAVARIMESEGAPAGALGDPNIMLQAVLRTVPLYDDPSENTTLARTLIHVAQSNLDILLHIGFVQQVVMCLVTAALVNWDTEEWTEKRVRPDVANGDANDKMTALDKAEMRALIVVLSRIRERAGDDPLKKLNLTREDAASLAKILRSKER